MFGPRTREASLVMVLVSAEANPVFEGHYANFPRTAGFKILPDASISFSALWLNRI